MFTIWLVLSLPWTSSLLMQEWRPAKFLQEVRAQERACGPGNPCTESNFYCVSGVCKQLSELQLIHYSTKPTSFSGCNQPHLFNVTLSIQNKPSNLVVSSKSLLLNGSIPGTVEDCWEEGSLIYCNLTVPALPECSEGSYHLSPNILNFTVQFTDDAGVSFTRNLVTTISDLDIQSWVCGNQQCESDLGENQQNCCCDCGCPSGQYCDLDFGCMPEPIDFDLIPKVITSDSATFEIRIDNAPRDIEVIPHITNLTCKEAGIVPITLSGISIECEGGEWANGSYRTECILNYQIADYSYESQYLMQLDLDLTLSYTSCQTPVQKTLSKHVTFTLNKLYCGNLIPELEIGENSSSCCYDVPCPTGEFCDITDNEIGALITNTFSPDEIPFIWNRCKKFEDFRIENVWPPDTITAFTQYHQGTRFAIMDFNVTFSFENMPKSAKDVIPGGCEILTQEIKDRCSDPNCCLIDHCELNESNVTCELITPAIRVRSEDIENNVFSSLQGEISFRIKFNNGSQEIEKPFDSEFEANVEIKARCGNGVFEEDLGETFDNCCQDAEAEVVHGTCEDKYGEGFECVPEIGKCVNLSQIDIFLDFPGSINCDHLYAQGFCTFDTEFNIQVTKPLDVNVSLNQIILEIGDQPFQVSCDQGENVNEHLTVFPCEIYDGWLEEEGSVKQGMDDAANNGEDHQEQQKETVFINLSVQSVVDSTPVAEAVFKNLTKNVTFNVVFPEAVKQCWEYKEDVEDDIEDVEDAEDELKDLHTFLLVVAGLAFLFQGICCVCCTIAKIPPWHPCENFCLIRCGEWSCCCANPLTCYSLHQICPWTWIVGCGASLFACGIEVYKDFLIDDEVEDLRGSYDELYEKCQQGAEFGYFEDVTDLQNKILEIEAKYGEVDGSGMKIINYALDNYGCMTLGLCITSVLIWGPFGSMANNAMFNPYILEVGGAVLP